MKTYTYEIHDVLRSLLVSTVFAAGGAAAAEPSTPTCTDNSAACLEKVGRLYIAALLSHDGSALPLAPDIRRTENALTNARGASEVRESFARTTMVKHARDIRFWADEKTNEIVFFFSLDIDLAKDEVGAGTTKAGNRDYKVAVTVPQGSYTVHEAERFKITHGVIGEVEIIAHVEADSGKGSGWPVERESEVKKP